MPRTCSTLSTQQTPFIGDFSPGQQKLLLHTELNPTKQNQLNTERTAESSLDSQGKREAANYSPAQLLPASKAPAALSLCHPAGGGGLLYESHSWKVPARCTRHWSPEQTKQTGKQGCCTSSTLLRDPAQGAWDAAGRIRNNWLRFQGTGEIKTQAHTREEKQFYTEIAHPSRGSQDSILPQRSRSGDWLSPEAATTWCPRCIFGVVLNQKSRN